MNRKLIGRVTTITCVATTCVSLNTIVVWAWEKLGQTFSIVADFVFVPNEYTLPPTTSVPQKGGRMGYKSHHTDGVPHLGI